jgi:hypothetical protein
MRSICAASSICQTYDNGLWRASRKHLSRHGEDFLRSLSV